MKQIVDKLNDIAKAIDSNVELSERDLIIDSLDSITEALGGTPNDSNLIVDKLEAIAGVAHGGGGGGTLATVEFEENGTYLPSDYEAYGFGEVTVNVSGGGGVELRKGTITIVNNSSSSQNTLDFVSGLVNIDNNGCLYQDQITGETVGANTTVVIDGFINKVVLLPFGGGEPIIGYALCSFENFGTASNLTNCYIADSGDFEGQIMVTDPTQDCSLTITLNENPGV